MGVEPPKAGGFFGRGGQGPDAPKGPLGFERPYAAVPKEGRTIKSGERGW